MLVLQILKYFDAFFTAVFSIEITLKVSLTIQCYVFYIFNSLVTGKHLAVLTSARALNGLTVSDMQDTPLLIEIDHHYELANHGKIIPFCNIG